MILACTILFLVAAAGGEYALWRLMAASPRSRRWGRAYGWTMLAVWVLFLGMGVAMKCGWLAAEALRGFGILLVFSLFCGLAGLLLALGWGVGRRAGHATAGRVVAGVLVVVVAVVMLCGTTRGRTRLRVERETVASGRVPEAFDGYRIAFFSDVHTGFLAGGDRQLERLVTQLNGVQADLVVCGGDLVNTDYRELDSGAVAILSGIRARDGVVSVLGNHDLGIYMRDTLAVSREENIRRIVAAERAMGWRVLRDSSLLIVRGGDTLSVTGLDYPDELHDRSHGRVREPFDPSPAYRGGPVQGYNLTVSHAPQVWDRILEVGRGDLTLSGHVHSMQFKVRVGRWRWSPAAWLYDRWSGRYDEAGRVLYITDGIGCALLPMRVGTRPEITVLELKRKP